MKTSALKMKELAKPHKFINTNNLSTEQFRYKEDLVDIVLDYPTLLNIQYAYAPNQF